MNSCHFNYFMKMSRDRLWWISEGSGISSSEGCPPKDHNVVCVEIKYYNFHSLWLRYLSLCQDSKLFSQINITLLHDFSNRAYFLLFLCNIPITAILQELTFQGGILMNYFYEPVWPMGMAQSVFESTGRMGVFLSGVCMKELNKWLRKWID